MAFPLQAIPQYPLTVQFESTKFFRRTDLTTDIRFAIAIKALYGQLNGVWGTVTQIAKEMNISRPFIYSLASSLKVPQTVPAPNLRITMMSDSI